MVSYYCVGVTLTCATWWGKVRNSHDCIDNLMFSIRRNQMPRRPIRSVLEGSEMWLHAADSIVQGSFNVNTGVNTVPPTNLALLLRRKHSDDGAVPYAFALKLHYMTKSTRAKHSSPCNYRTWVVSVLVPSSAASISSSMRSSYGG